MDEEKINEKVDVDLIEKVNAKHKAAELEIRTILLRLQRETGLYVRDLGIQRINVTTFGSEVWRSELGAVTISLGFGQY